MKQDRSTLHVLWLVIMTSIAAGVFVVSHWRWAALPHGEEFAIAGVVLFVPGLIVRWWAIIQLGRFFTVDVTIAKDHELVDAGPFRLVRHPSYTGAMLAFVGFAFTLGNWAAMLVIVAPIFAAFIRRMNVEEEALLVALGDNYAAYMARNETVGAVCLLRWKLLLRAVC